MLKSTLKKNIGANFAGSIWQAVMGLVFVPLYIQFMGIESYGLIGIFTTLQIIFGLLDIGLGSTLTREMARLSVLPNKEQEMRDLVRTLEILYWGVAIFVGIIVMSSSPFIAHHWVKPGELSSVIVEQSILIMGIVMVFQMPIGFYSGGLLGLQEQVPLNIINICMSTLRGAGVILILWLVSPTIYAFLLWQVGISIMNVFLTAIFLWRKLPVSEGKAVFQKKLLDGIWRFAAGMSGIAILGVILTQMDKIILSKILSLEMFGFYMLANVVAMSLIRIVIPIFNGIYPKFVQLASLDDQEGLKKLYHTSCQLISVMILPVAIIIALFSYEIILLWTQNPITAAKTHKLISILICGTALHCLMYPPYALQLAFGWTKLSFYKNIIAVIILIPITIYLALRYGAIGAACVWLILNIGYIIFEISVMHKRLLQTEKWSWYKYDVCAPLLVAFFFAGIGKLVFINTSSKYIILINLIIVFILTFGMTFISIPAMRSILSTHLMRMKLKI